MIKGNQRLPIHPGEPLIKPTETAHAAHERLRVRMIERRSPKGRVSLVEEHGGGEE